VSCRSTASRPDGAVVCFDDSSAERFDVVVGADGVNSAVRDTLLGRRSATYARYTVWRGLADVPEDVAPSGVHRQLWGSGRRFGFYRVGGGRLYWWAAAGLPAGHPQQEAGSHLPFLRELLAGWLPPVTEILDGTAEGDVRFDRVYHAPRPARWGAGRVTLLGDAAHAMTFNVGQGACQAIEDAVVLARELADPGRAAEASLRRYEAQRSRRTAPLVSRARRIGALGLVRGRAACAVRDSALRVLLNGPGVAQHTADMRFDI
jgi:2-polyprenyl-6-methoxyphenol hydroxylase-like FAD-dependent oxidoreductase